MGDKIHELIEFAVSEAVVSGKTEVTLDSRLYEELGLTGADAVEFILAYSKKFSVDVSRFMAADYFAAEGLSWLRGNKGKKTLTLRDLLKGIEHGKLDEAVLK